MNIIIENCSSPGASFTDNTNNVIIKCYEWISENEQREASFSVFRKELTLNKGINADNARNIYPLLKKCGFINYESRGELLYKNFFTNNGLMYVKTLLLLEELNNDIETNSTIALKKATEIVEELIFQGIANLLVNEDASYKKELYEMIKYVIVMGKINKQEFAYLLYELNNSGEAYSDSFRNSIHKYRNKDISIEVQMRVRNDLKIREKTKEETRLEPITYFTPYTYLSALLCQAGILVKGEDKNYLYLNNLRKTQCESLLKETNYE